MPSPYKTKVCEWCGTSWKTRKGKARTCSPKCRARLRETEKPSSGKPKREYPEATVDKVLSLYESGMTVAEVQAAVPGVKVQLVLQRFGAEMRPAIARSPKRGPDNPSWKGENASYTAFHLRVEKARGKPSKCEHCGTEKAGRYEWANLTGNYHDINDYVRMCVACHRRYDAVRRKITGRRTSPERR